MELSTCRIIVKIAELRSLTQTAEYFSYTPSRISQILKSTEVECGVPLFHRTKSGLLPTPECELLLAPLRDMLDSERRFQEQLCRLRQIKPGILRIGAFTSLSCHWLPQRLKAFSAAYPNIRFELKMADVGQIEAWTRNGAVDLGLAAAPQSGDLHFIQLAEDPYALVVPEGHPLAGCRNASLDRLRQEPFIFLEPEDNRGVEEHLAGLGFRPQVRCRVKDDYTIMSLVESGLGVSILPELVLNRAPYRIRTVELQPACSRQIGILLQKSGTVSRAAQYFVSFCQAMEQSEPALQSASA